MKIEIRKSRTVICALWLFFLATCGLAQQAPPPNAAHSSADLASMDLEQLMNLQVTTASMFSDKVSEAPGIMSVVTRDELQRFGGITLGEILERVPGLTQSSQYFTDRSMVAADGDQTKTSGCHILFLINGRPTREVMEGGIVSDLLESFPVEILERIEIIRGPGSVLYGSNAFSAVVNLITRKASANQISAKGLVGANGALASSGHFLYKRGDFSIVGASQIHEAPDWNLIYLVPPPLQNLPTAPPEPPFHDTTLVDRGTGDYLGLNYKGLSLMSAFTEWQSTSFTAGAVGETRLTRDFADLGYTFKARDNWDMQFNGTYTRTTFGLDSYPDVTRDSNEFLAEWTNLITLTSKDRLTAGMLFTRIAGTELYHGLNPPVPDAHGSRPAGGFYAQLDHQLLESVKLIAGFQSNKFGSIPLNTVPRAGVIWNPSPFASVKVLYGEAFRPPSIIETTVNLPDIQGNPNLRPELVETFNLGLDLHYSHLQLGADYFHSHQIRSIASAGRPIRYENLGGVIFDGFVADGKYYFRRDFFTQASLLYQANHNENGTSNVTPIPNLGFKGGVSYENTRGLVFGLFDVSDGKPKPYAYNVNPLTGWHHSLNAEVRQDVSRYLQLSEKNSIAIAVHATDLLNQRVWLPGFGFSNIDSIPVQQGRTIYAGLEFSHGQR